MLVEALSSFLTADAGVQAQVGTPTTRSDKTTGIFPVIAPPEVPVPYVVMTQVSGDGDPEYTLAGTGRLHEARWRFSCHGSTYKQAKATARALKVALVGMFGHFSTGNCDVEGAHWIMEADDAEQIPHGTLYSTHLDFLFQYVDND